MAEDAALIKGFFYGEEQVNRQSLEFCEVMGLFSFGLIKLEMTIVETGKSYAVVTDHYNLKLLKATYQVDSKKRLFF